ncbi:MAG: polysaccharide biosynthesis C-terminal domain-containing protein, partial [Bacteroidota bacterium]
AGNALLIVCLNLVVKCIYLFGIDRTVQNVLPEGEYGLFFTLYNFAFLFQIVADLGLQQYNLRTLSQSRQLLGKYLPYLLGLRLLLGLGFVLLTVGLGWLWGFRSSFEWWLLFGIAFNQVLQTGVVFLRSNLSGLGWYRLDSWVSVLDKLLLVLIGAVLLWPTWRSSFQLTWFILAHTLAYSLSIIVIVSLLWPRLTRLRPAFSWAKTRAILRQSLPFALVVFLMTAYTRLDAIMIEKLLAEGAVEADRYASAFRLLDASNIAGYLLAGLLLPMFARLLQTGESVRPLVRLGVGTLGVGSITLGISCWYFATPIMESLYENGSAYTGDILRWLMLGFIPMSVAYVYGSLLAANASLRPLNILFASSIPLNIILNAWLIPRAGAVGAAQATFWTQAIAALGQIWLAYRIMKLHVQPELIGRFVGFVLLLGGAGYGLLSATWPLPWWLGFVLLLVTGLVLAFVFKLLELRTWLDLARAKTGS